MDLRLLLWTVFTGLAFTSSIAQGSIGYGGPSIYGYGGYQPLHGYGGHGVSGYGGYGHGYGGYGHGFGGYGHGFGGYGHGFGGYGDEHYGHGGYDDDHDNNDDCIEATPPPGAEVVCALPKEVGSGSGLVTQYFFNYPEGKCERFTYRGSGGNDNRFDTLEGCNTFCLGVANPCGSNKKRNKKHNHGPYDHLYGTKHRIDSYLAKSYLLGKRRLNVEVEYLNTPLEYQYLNQYHGLKHPLTHTPFASLFGIRNAPSGHYQGHPAHHIPVRSSQRYQSYGTPQAGYGNQGYTQRTPQHYGPVKPYQQNVYASNTVPKQPVYVKRTAVTQTYQNTNAPYAQTVSVSGHHSHYGHTHTTHNHVLADQGGLGEGGHPPAEAVNQ